MNTLNGNFIERSIPNIKNATLNLLIGDQVATMNLADFQTAILSSYSFSKGLKMKDDLSLSSTLNTVVDSNETITESPLYLSTTQVNIGGGSSLGRLAVRGDGTNPVARFESLAGTNGWTINPTSLDFLPIVTNVNSLGSVSNRINNIYANTLFGGASNNFSINLIAGGFNGTFTVNQNYDYNGQKGTWMFNQTTYGVQVNNSTSGIGSHIYGSYTFKPSASSTASPRALWLEYDLNRNGQTVSGTATGIMINATETDITGMTHNLMDLQVGGVSKAKINNIGSQTLAYSLTVGSSSVHYFQLGAGLVVKSPSDGNATFLNSAETSFGRLQLGGTTSSFPAIKRNGAGISFVLADDSAFCNVNVQSIIVNGFIGNVNTGIVQIGGGGSSSANAYFNAISESFGFGASSINASAKLQIDSTTKGFLMPRMTTAQINAIVTPAEGLQVYNITLLVPCFYDGTGWRKVTHSTM